MSIEDFTPDTGYKTPSGLVLNKLARNPHLNSDTVHGCTGGGSQTQTTTFNLTVPDIDNGQSFIQTIQPENIIQSLNYDVSLSGEYNNEPLVIINVMRVDPVSFRVEVRNESGNLVTTRSVVITFLGV